RVRDDVPNLLAANPDGFDKADRSRVRLAGFRVVLNSEHADPMTIAKKILPLHERWRCRERDDRVISLHSKNQRIASVRRYNPLHVIETLDGTAIDRNDHVTHLEAGRGGNTVRLNSVDTGNEAWLAEIQRHSSEDHGRQQEICNRSGGHDRCPRP